MHSASTHAQGTPLDPRLRSAAAELIQPGMYARLMKDDSMDPYITKGELVFFKENHAVSNLVDVIYGKDRLIRMMRPGIEKHHWIYYPANLKYEPLYSTQKNCPEFRILGTYCFAIHFGKVFKHFEGEVIRKLIQAGDIRKLLAISKFNRAGGEIRYDFGKE